jgi:hypothetical protein
MSGFGAALRSARSEWRRAKHLVNPFSQKYYTLTKFGYDVCLAHPGSPRGAIDRRHVSRAGDAVDAAASAREVRAGRLTP